MIAHIDVVIESNIKSKISFIDIVNEANSELGYGAKLSSDNVTNVEVVSIAPVDVNINNRTHMAAFDGGRFPELKNVVLYDGVYTCKYKGERNAAIDIDFEVSVSKNAGSFVVKQKAKNKCRTVMVKFRVYSRLLNNKRKHSISIYKSPVNVYVGSKESGYMKTNLSDADYMNVALRFVSKSKTGIKKSSDDNNGCDICVFSSSFEPTLHIETYLAENSTTLHSLWCNVRYTEPSTRRLIEDTIGNVADFNLYLVLNDDYKPVSFTVGPPKDLGQFLKKNRDEVSKEMKELSKRKVDYLLSNECTDPEVQFVKSYLNIIEIFKHKFRYSSDEVSEAEMLYSKLCDEGKANLYCDFNDETYRVVGYSRLGDLWLNTKLDVEAISIDDTYSYVGDKPCRVNWTECSNWRHSKDAVL